MTPSLLESGLQLTAYGMGTVFVFLVLLIYATRGMSTIAAKIHTPGTSHGPQPGVAMAGPGGLKEEERVAVITAAVAQFRARRPE